MRDKIAIGLSLLALVIGALSLYEGWARARGIVDLCALVIFLVAKYYPVSRFVGIQVKPPSAVEISALNAIQWAALAVIIAMAFL
jgi:hypothetical protein